MRGNVFANDVKIKNNGMLLGDIQCLCLTLDPTASIKVSFVTSDTVSTFHMWPDRAGNGRSLLRH